MSDIVRVLRIIEYIGHRNRVEEVVKNSVHGTKICDSAKGLLSIHAVTLGLYPEILLQNSIQENKNEQE